MSKYKTLTEEQVQNFLDKGYLVVKDCLDLSLANRWIDEAYERLGYDKHDPSTWQKDIIWMDHKNQLPVPELAPKAWNAILDVVGGEDRLEPQVMQIESSHFTTIDSSIWSDAFIVNFHKGADKPWQPPSSNVPGWHKDGSYFRHFLDSREQALLTIVLWSDMLHQGGGTFVAPDSVRLMARHLSEHPEGVDPKDFKFQEMISQCTQFEEITGKSGDFVILHPFMLHASSQNVIGKPRFMSNPPIVLKEPMNLNRDNPEDFSLLERATLHYLGLERLAFRPTAPRESSWWPA
jgi:ectoine hydroxylase-related dioxygenase (phytanoyl-CoA dioxygenase family)